MATPPSEPTGEGKDAGLPPLHHRSALHGHHSSPLQLITAPTPSRHEPKVIHVSPYPAFHARHRVHVGTAVIASISGTAKAGA
jgi:hypothetical protein